MDLQSVGVESLINLLAYDCSWPLGEQTDLPFSAESSSAMHPTAEINLLGCLMVASDPKGTWGFL